MKNLVLYLLLLINVNLFSQDEFKLINWSVVNNGSIVIEDIYRNVNKYEISINICDNDTIRNLIITRINSPYNFSSYQIKENNCSINQDISPTISIEIIDYIRYLRLVKVTNLTNEIVSENCLCDKIYYFNDGSIVKKLNIFSK